MNGTGVGGIETMEQFGRLLSLVAGVESQIRAAVSLKPSNFQSQGQALIHYATQTPTMLLNYNLFTRNEFATSVDDS